MSTSTHTPATSSSSSPSSLESVITPAQQRALISNLSLGALIVCPILIALPPRKLDTYTLALLVGTGLGANQVSREYTGVSISERFKRRMISMAAPLPPKAMEMQERIKREKEARARRAEIEAGTTRRLGDEKSLGPLAEVERTRRDLSGLEKQGDESGVPKVLEKVWYGGEGKDWKAKRDQREKEALEEGKGYGDLIMEQIWEVWNWGQGEAKDVKEIDERVVAEKKPTTERPN